jgi:hypothetical protein
MTFRDRLLATLRALRPVLDVDERLSTSVTGAS